MREGKSIKETITGGNVSREKETGKKGTTEKTTWEKATISLEQLI